MAALKKRYMYSSPSAKGIVTTQTRVFHAPAFATQSPIAIQASLRFNPTMTNAVNHANTRTHALLANEPILRRSLVK